MPLIRKSNLRLSESICINTVEDSYKKAINKLHNVKFMNIFIKPGSKTAKNCIKFVELANSTGKSILKLTEEALSFFDPEFCQRIFKRDYPQVTFIVSEKTINRLYLQNKPTIKINKKDYEKVADQYMGVLVSMDSEMAIEAIKGGWPDDAPQVRKILIRRLNGKIKV